MPFSPLELLRAIDQPLGHNGVVSSTTTEMPELLEVTTPSLAYICLGGFAVLFSMVSLLVKEKLFINEVVLGTAFGIVMGPYGAGIFDPRAWGHQTNTVTLEVMRIVLAIGLFAIGVEIPRSYMRDHAKGLSVMVVPTMAIGWIIVTALLRFLFPQIGIYGCLAIAACLTPTDPIISAAIVGGKFAMKHVPLNLRQMLSAESAANDGLAYPFLSIAIYLIVDKTAGEAVLHWVLIGWLYEVICGTILGAVMGWAFSHLMRISYEKGYIDRESFIAQYLALAFLTIGIASTLGLDDLLAAFAAGNALSWDGNFNEHVEDSTFSSVIDLVFNCTCFIYIGAWLPFQSYTDPALGLSLGRLVLLFVGILVFRRIPSVLMLYPWIEEIEGWRQAVFTGHFGPMGVGAIFVSTLAATRLPEPKYPPETQTEIIASVLQPIVSFVVLGSIIIHGLSIPFFNISQNISLPLPTTANLIPNLPHLPNLPYWSYGWDANTRRSSRLLNGSEAALGSGYSGYGTIRSTRSSIGRPLSSASGTIRTVRTARSRSKMRISDYDREHEHEGQLVDVEEDEVLQDGMEFMGEEMLCARCSRVIGVERDFGVERE